MSREEANTILSFWRAGVRRYGPAKIDAALKASGDLKLNEHEKAQMEHRTALAQPSKSQVRAWRKEGAANA